MGIFNDVPIGWKDKDYVIPADRVLKAIACIEEVITLREIVLCSRRGTMPMARLSMAYAVVLRFAGAAVTDEEVYEGMFSGDDVQQAVNDSVNGLLTMMLPVSEQSGEGKEHNPGNSRKGAARSSRKSTRQRSAAGC